MMMKREEVTALECLPTVIGNSVRIIITQNEFSSDPQINCEKIQNTEISSTWKINISDIKYDRKLCLFVKYLDCRNNYFSPETGVYFKNELVYYGDILEMFNDINTISTGRNKSNRLTFSPLCIRVSAITDERPFIIMEDLVADGYTPLNVNQPLSFECAQVILNQLGRFHAYSFAAKDQRLLAFADATSKLYETVFRRESRSTFGKMFIHAIHGAFKLAKQSLPSDSVYVEKFATFTLDIFDRMAELAEGVDKEDIDYKVITHGDLWLNNILYKFSNNSVTFIDYQACRYASPVHDLMFILLVGLDKSTRERHRNELIHCYHNTLCQTLQDLGSDPLRLFPYSALQQQLLRHTKFTLALALVGLPLYLNEGLNSTPQDTVSNVDESNLDTLFEFMHKLQNRKTMQCKNKMLEIIMDVIDEGYL